MLEVKDLNASYGSVHVLRGVALDVQEGEFVTIIGGNGSGKTTLMMSISGIKKPGSGTIEFLGNRIDKLPPYDIIRLGLVQVPQWRMLFPDMTVLENLELGALRATDDKTMDQRLEWVYSHFEILANRRKQKAGMLSGGEQQMLTIGRALMLTPRLLMLDEPTAGLAPIMVQEVARILSSLNKGGLTTILVEQNALLALELAEKAYILINGSLTKSKEPSELLQSDEAKRAYLGLV